MEILSRKWKCTAHLGSSIICPRRVRDDHKTNISLKSPSRRSCENSCIDLGSKNASINLGAKAAGKILLNKLVDVIEFPRNTRFRRFPVDKWRLVPGLQSVTMLLDRTTIDGPPLFPGEEESGGGTPESPHNCLCCPSRPLGGPAGLERLSATLRHLGECGWYYGPLSKSRSVTLLKKGEVGLFLLRDSSDPRFLFSLSVQTAKGPTSVRIHYSDGMFRLDAEPSIKKVPKFNSVVALVEHYVGVPQVCLSGSGYTHIHLRKPLYRTFPSLKHLTRLTLNRLGPPDPTSLPIPVLLKKYLTDYPYKS